jgi:hypothetical protein
MNEPQLPQPEFERQQLLTECHLLVTHIGRSAYSTKLLKTARDGLLLVAGIKLADVRRTKVDLLWRIYSPTQKR